MDEVIAVHQESSLNRWAFLIPKPHLLIFSTSPVIDLVGLFLCEKKMSNEKQIEQEIQDKGLNAPRLTPDHIDSKIKAIRYITGDKFDLAYCADDYKSCGSPQLTICILSLENGFTVTGESACASPENFDRIIGQKIAYENARNKIWQLEGYLLKEKLSKESV